jgi:hypothetical protein
MSRKIIRQKMLSNLGGGNEPRNAFVSGKQKKIIGAIISTKYLLFQIFWQSAGGVRYNLQGGDSFLKLKFADIRRNFYKAKQIIVKLPTEVIKM